jgi:hypothetical protein
VTAHHCAPEGAWRERTQRGALPKMPLDGRNTGRCR